MHSHCHVYLGIGDTSHSKKQQKNFLDTTKIVHYVDRQDPQMVPLICAGTETHCGQYPISVLMNALIDNMRRYFEISVQDGDLRVSRRYDYSMLSETRMPLGDLLEHEIESMRQEINRKTNGDKR
jgi:hypothetical protein